MISSGELLLGIVFGSFFLEEEIVCLVGSWFFRLGIGLVCFGVAGVAGVIVVSVRNLIFEIFDTCFVRGTAMKDCVCELLGDFLNVNDFQVVELVLGWKRKFPNSEVERLCQVVELVIRLFKVS